MKRRSFLGLLGAAPVAVVAVPAVAKAVSEVKIATPAPLPMYDIWVTAPVFDGQRAAIFSEQTREPLNKHFREQYEDFEGFGTAQVKAEGEKIKW